MEIRKKLRREGKEFGEERRGKKRLEKVLGLIVTPGNQQEVKIKEKEIKVRKKIKVLRGKMFNRTTKFSKQIKP